MGSFVLNTLRHSSLRCRNRDHFSAIAPPRFVSLEDLRRDLARMPELFGDVVGPIGVIGSEPLLHPQVDQILVARRRFPSTMIELATNGILFPRQADAFWDACRREHIVIVMTTALWTSTELDRSGGASVPWHAQAVPPVVQRQWTIVRTSGRPGIRVTLALLSWRVQDVTALRVAG